MKEEWSDREDDILFDEQERLIVILSSGVDFSSEILFISRRDNGGDGGKSVSEVKS